MEFKIINHGQAQYIEINKPYIVISITEKNVKSAQYIPDSYCQGILFMKFHDVDSEESNDIQYLDAITKEQSQQIIQFVVLMEPSIDLIVCQCMAGISRSSAVAAGLAKILNGDDSYFSRSKGTD